MPDVRRREVIALLGGGAAAWPLAARAQQQPAMPVIGYLSARSPEDTAHLVEAFRRGLSEVGFVENRNLTIEFRWAYNQYDRLPALAADLVSRQVAVMAATGGDPLPQIAKAATQTIPIVFQANGDPVSNGLVASLNRPGGNATGITIFGAAAVTKRLQLLHELVPQAAAIAFLLNPNNPNADIEVSAVGTAAASLGKELLILHASSEDDLATAFATMIQQRREALLVASSLRLQVAFRFLQLCH
jgi:putative tryptophan/tyrosine transport system substrate-binding protein